MKLHLQLRQSQTLAPQLIQSLKMLQMPALRLEQTIRQELATNPMLEEIEELEADTDDDEESEFEVAEDEKDKESDDSVDWEEFLFDDDDGYKIRETKEQREEIIEGSAAQTNNLYHHLTEQLHLLKLTEQEQLIGEYIIGNISPDGYLGISVEEMGVELDIPNEKINEVLEMIKRFDPSGIGARNLRESLMIQFRDKGMEGTLAYRIVDEHITDLERKSILQLSKLMGTQEERIQVALEEIKALSPAPAHGRFDQGAMPIVPDLIVERIGDEYVVFHNNSHMPRLRINSSYKQLVKRGNSSSEDTKNYIKQKLEQARWLLNSINQRRSTMIRVMQSIIERQSEFFEKGPAFLKPLIMEDIAQMVDMNVATISRVANSKYVQTPLGVYEIKHFFNSGITREDGSDMSKRSVKQRIREIIEAELAAKPLSDQEIFRRLNEEGIKLARRTVTKYREELKIPSARLRKRVGV
ncbi:MAG: RNA polymerase factor sigma-54 [candidate division Zixibacteria bacterium]|nr:RNA polymerase factor sigma-54 [candidate division Zixibacteria bacterium]